MKRGLAAVAAISGLVVFLATLHYAGAQNNTTPTFSTSRFALLSGPYTVTPELKGEPGKNENGIFKLDTYSGKVWKLSVTVDPDGKRSEKWQPIEDKP